MWLQGDGGDPRISSLSFSGMGLSPWAQPRGCSASSLGLQADVYQAMAAAAALQQDVRSLDPSKQPFMQIPQLQSLPPGSSSTPQQPQMLPHPKQAFHQESPQYVIHQSPTQPQSHQLLQQQLPQQHSFNEQQLVNHQQVPSNSTTSQPVPPLCQQMSFSDSNGNSVSSPMVSPLQSLLGSYPQEEPSRLGSVPQASIISSPSSWPSKRAAVERLNVSGDSNNMSPEMQQAGPLNHSNNINQGCISLPPFPGARDCSVDQEGNTDPQGRLLFGVNLEPSSLLMQDGLSSLRGVVGSDGESTNLPFTSNYMSNNNMGAEFGLNTSITPNGCIDESGFLQSPENMGQVNVPSRTFVKVMLAWNYFLWLWRTYTVSFSSFLFTRMRIIWRKFIELKESVEVGYISCIYYHCH